MKVLILDADCRFAEQATSFLESFAHLVVHETEADNALEHARHWQADLVMVSAELAENTNLISSLKRLLPRPAVLLTDHMDSFARAWRVWQKGGDELLMKPVFKSRELYNAIITAIKNATLGTRREPQRLAASA
jgi:DNA-binding response OmpR family regulator